MNLEIYGWTVVPSYFDRFNIFAILCSCHLPSHLAGRPQKQGNRLTRRPATVDIFFLHSQDEMLKTQCFFTLFIFGRHLESIICTAWANSKWIKRYFVQAKRSFFYHAGKNSLEMPVDPRNPFCHKHLGSSSKMELVCDGSILPPLEASRPLPTIFVGSSRGFVFLGKSDWRPCFQVFWYVQA